MELARDLARLGAFCAESFRSLPEDVRGVLFGLFESPDEDRDSFALHLFGTRSFAVADDGWTVDECWRPAQRYLRLESVASASTWQEAHQRAVEILSLMRPWEAVPDSSVLGFAVGFDDGDIEVLWTREQGPSSRTPPVDDLGQGSLELEAYVRAFTASGYPTDAMRDASCSACGGAWFHLSVDVASGCAARRCNNCGVEAFIADSQDYWDDSAPQEAACTCGAVVFQVAVGFALFDSGEVRWVTVGGRCRGCGLASVFVDWKIDYEPSKHLVDAV